MNAAHYESPASADEYSMELIRIIKHWIPRELNGVNYSSSNMCFDKEDVLQEIIEDTLPYLKKYDPTKLGKNGKPSKFSTYITMVVRSRLGNFRGKVQRRMQNQTYSMTELNAGWGITGSESSGEENNTHVSHFYDSYVKDLKRSNDAMNEILDAKKILEKLTNERQIIFAEYYIKGKTFKEIHEVTGIKYHVIRRNMKYLEPIYNTLIKGDTPCLH